MVIVADRNGQLCNRLFHFSYFIANAIEFNYSLIYPYFEEYAHYFENEDNQFILNYPIRIKITQNKFIDKVIRYSLRNYRLPLPKVRYIDIHKSQQKIYDLKNADFQKLAKNNVVVTYGWCFRDEENLKKHRFILKSLFKPQPIFAAEVKSIINTLRADYDCIVGVHVRRGDYLAWEEGKFYYADNVYIKKMEEFILAMNYEQKKICFIICSNEDIDTTSYQQFNIHHNINHPMVDLYTLAACNYIIGPPSTFNQWASFYGNVPLFSIFSANKILNINNFSTY